MFSRKQNLQEVAAHFFTAATFKLSVLLNQDLSVCFCVNSQYFTVIVYKQNMVM